MHEMSIALSIIDIVEREAAQADAVSVNEIELEIGQLSGVEIDALNLALSSAKMGTVMEKAETKIITVEAAANCHDCGKTFTADDIYFASCPYCQSIDCEVVTGKELKVKSINVN
jgi:hydrogenase nickel incorporation protein HypA/HybF